MKSLFPTQTKDIIAASVLLSNTYLSVGEHQQAEAVRANRIRQYGRKVQVGSSWTEVDDELVVSRRSFNTTSQWVTILCLLLKEFRAHDRSHPLSAGIYAVLHHMSTQLKEHGHQFDSSWVTRPLREGESIESVLCGHSEKLAIAFNFLRRPNATFIQVTKNLRMCGDCRKCRSMGEVMFTDTLMFS